jgi:hypothetical protein
MEGKRSFRPSPAMVVACLALFVALGTGAYAVKFKLKPNQVKTKNIRTAAVTGPKLAANAVTESKIASGSITGPKLAAGALTKAKIGASGSNSNTSNYSLIIGACTQDTTIPIPGAQPGDAVAFAVRVAGSVGGQLSVSAGGNTVGSNGNFAVEVCNHNGTANVTPGSITLDWVAIR